MLFISLFGHQFKTQQIYFAILAMTPKLKFLKRVTWEPCADNFLQSHMEKFAAIPDPSPPEESTSRVDVVKDWHAQKVDRWTNINLPDAYSAEIW